MPLPLSWGIGRAATLLKTVLQYYGMSLEALPGVAYPGFRDNRSTLNTKTGLKKWPAQLACCDVVCVCLIANCRRLLLPRWSVRVTTPPHGSDRVRSMD